MTAHERFWTSMTSLLLLVPLLIAGCSKSDPISVPILVRPPEMSGAWSLSGPGSVMITMQTSQKGTSINGSCTIGAGGPTVNGSVYGNCTFPDVNLTIVIPGYYDVRFTGRMTGETTVTGVLNGSGFTDHPMTGTRR